MQWSVLNRTAAVSSLWLRSPGIQNQPAKHGTLPAHQAERGPWAVPKGHKYKPLHTHAQQRTHLCRPPLLLRLRRCEATLLVAKYSAQRITSPKPGLSGAKMWSLVIADAPSTTQRKLAPPWRRHERGGGGGVTVTQRVSWAVSGPVRHALARATPTRASECATRLAPGRDSAEKNPSIRCTKLPLFCWSGLWITNICTRAT